MLTSENLTYRIENQTILEDISLQISTGELLAVLGPNGAGKSSLLKCLSGDVSEVLNQVELNQRMLSFYSAEQLASIRAVMPQSVYLDFPFLVSEVVEMALMTVFESAKRQALIEQALSYFDVTHLMDRNYLTLSGGEQQRVQLARVVAQLLCHRNDATQYLLLDECTSNLDLAHQHQVFKVIKSLVAEHNLSTVIVLHDLNLASQYADRLLLMHSGKVVALGEAEKVLTPPQIEAVYGLPVQIMTHPKGWPMVVPV